MNRNMHRQASIEKLRESGIAVGVAALALVWMIFSGTVGRGAGVPNVAPGKTLFKENCASCHGPDGAGNTPLAKSMKAANLHSAEVQNKSNVLLAQIINNGAGDMPSFKNSLTADQIHALLDYLRALPKKK